MSESSKNTAKRTPESTTRNPTLNEISKQKLCMAARRYARSVASDDTTFVHAFLTALNNGIELNRPALNGEIITTFMDTPIPSASLLDDPIFSANARRLYASHRSQIIPKDDSQSAMYPECVVIRQHNRFHTGVLVARNLVVTTAHCSSLEVEQQVLFGLRADAPERSIHVQRAIHHPDFNPATHTNDIALLILDEDVEGLPYAHIADSKAIDTATAIRVAGFGHTNTTASIPAGIKRIVDVPIASSRHIYIRQGRAFASNPEIELVAGRPALGRDSCSVDSGDPSYIRVENRWRLCGIISRPILSYHYPCGDGTIIVRIDHYMHWIRSLPGITW